jgi:hypothetical protein
MQWSFGAFWYIAPRKIWQPWRDLIFFSFSFFVCVCQRERRRVTWQAAESGIGNGTGRVPAVILEKMVDHGNLKCGMHLCMPRFILFVAILIVLNASRLL